MARPIEPLHPLWILLATSVASASGWGEGEGVRYRTYRSGAAAPTPVAAPTVEAIHPWVRLGVAEDIDVWVEPWLLWTPGFAPFDSPAPFSSIATTPPAPAEGEEGRR